MGEPNTETCEAWTTAAAVQARPGGDDLDTDTIDRAVRSASWVLFMLTGRQWPGVCTDVVRPCRRQLSLLNPSMTRGWATSWDESWGTCACHAHTERGECGCDNDDQVALGAAPIVDVLEVRIDGEVIPESDYRIDDERWLVRLTEEGWPCCQNMRLNPDDGPADATPTFQVRFTYGVGPPQAGQDAATTLALELAKAEGTDDDGECRLPQRVQTLVREGVTMTLLDPFAFFADGRTGLYDVDLFIKTANPHGISRRAAVLNPDRKRPVRRGSQIGGS